MSGIQIYKVGSSEEPKFPATYEVEKKAVLQVTDIKTNRNKYYAIELHSAKNNFRVFTHYGRTDDLDSNPNAGVREARYCSSIQEAESVYTQILKEKTSAKKGYKEVNLASSKIGSTKSIGQSSGTIDDKTLKKLADKSPAPVKPIVTISTEVQELVSHLYSEATNALISTVNASITANGIETPLGVLTIGQIDKGQDVLDQIAAAFSKKKKDKDELIDLSGQFYTVIPHKFGRSKDAALSAVISSAEQINDKQDTLQLMRDMLNVNGKTNVLMNPEVEKKYQALDCHISMLSHSSDDFKQIKAYAEKSQVGYYKNLKVKNVFTLKREKEHKHFTTTIKNHKQLFHGSRGKNWVGILSRGLLLPKIVVTLGVTRTDAGWLGSGIYFGDALGVAHAYAGLGKRGTSLIALTNVALGKMKDYSKITYGLSKPPDGFDSCHGVRGTQFADDEYVIYDHSQQRMDYLLEVSG